MTSARNGGEFFFEWLTHGNKPRLLQGREIFEAEVKGFSGHVGGTTSQILFPKF